jgi:PAS domain S-box-containing protein
MRKPTGDHGSRCLILHSRGRRLRYSPTLVTGGKAVLLGGQLLTGREKNAAAVKTSPVFGVPLPQQPALQLIYDTAPIGLAFLSPDCRYLQINQRLTEICGISVEDHLGRSVRDCVPALAESVEGIVRSIMDTGDPVIGIEVAGQRADQTEERFWITYWHPLRSPSGEIVGINVAAEEITERKRAEAALQASEREIRSARDAAEAALRKLQATQNFLIEAEKLAALGRLVAGVAHEINNPVGTSLTVASSLQRKAAMFTAEVARGDLRRSSLNEFLDISREASSQLVANLTRAAELVQSFKQVATDRNYSNQRTFDLGDLTEQVFLSLRPGLGKQNLTLNVECQQGPTGPDDEQLSGSIWTGTNQPPPELDRARIPGGKGGTVDVKAQASGNDHVEIVFSDDGCGMSLDVRRKAFDPFFTTRRDQGGTGLGLHIVYSIVTNCLGGRLNLDSEPGRGTKIQLILPRVAPIGLTAQ